MTCFCSDYLAFYLHTSQPKIPIEGFYQEHIYSCSPDLALNVKLYMMVLEDDDNILSIDQSETNISYQVTVRIGKLQKHSRTA